MLLWKDLVTIAQIMDANTQSYSLQSTYIIYVAQKRKLRDLQVLINNSQAWDVFCLWSLEICAIGVW